MNKVGNRYSSSVAREYIKENKGRQLAVTGSIRTGSYDAKDGTKRYTTDIVVDSFEFIGSGQTNNNQDGAANNDGNNQGGFYDDMTPEYTEDCPF